MVSLLKVNRWVFSASALALTVSLGACAPSSNNQAGAGNAGGGGGTTITLNGAGATAPNPVYQRWFADYNKENPNVQISYQSVGSGAGVKQFLAETIDFGATDAPLKDDERSKYPTGRGATPIQIPTTGLFIVFAYNLDGVEDLKLSREVYCGIVDGSIKNWNDPAIAAENKDAKLPDLPIAYAYRSDGSGTTSIFTSHLEKACPNWKGGAGKSVEWPTGTGAKGNEGVTAQVNQTKGAIGYVEYSYAKENGLKMATLENKAGEYIKPTPEAAGKSLEGVEPDSKFVVSVPDPEAKEAYPIVSLTYLLLYSEYPEAAKGEAMKNLVTWMMKSGGTAAEELGYIPLPATMQDKVLAQLDNIKVASAK